MQKKRIAVALGGNALGETPEAQITAVRKASVMIADLIAQGHELILSHGNGPQVGMIHTAMCSMPDSSSFPFAECTAMSQGYIGYHIQQALGEELGRRGLPGQVLSVVTQIVVDPADPAFQNPEKPIGHYLSKEEAEALAKEKSWVFREFARGWRRVIASPVPLEIVEQKAVSCLLAQGITVIAGGGGGIPVIRMENGLQGIDAVIDKDRSTELLAEALDANLIIFLTAVNRVCLHYREPDQQELPAMTTTEAREYICQGQFAPGSMLPKVEAGVRFAESAPGRQAVITSLEHASMVLTKGAGTWISK